MASIAVFIGGALVTLASAYLVSLRLHPWWPCRSCDGSGKSRDTVWRKAHGTCPACGGRGRYPRLGVRILEPGRARRMTAGQPKHKITDQRRH